MTKWNRSRQFTPAENWARPSLGSQRPWTDGLFAALLLVDID